MEQRMRRKIHYVGLLLVLMMVGWSRMSWALVETDNYLLEALRDQGFNVVQDLGEINAKKQGLPAMEITDKSSAAYAVRSKLNTMMFSGTHARGLQDYARTHSGEKGFSMEADGEGRWLQLAWTMPTGRTTEHYRTLLINWKANVTALNADIIKVMQARGPDPKISGPEAGKNWTSPSTGMEFVWVPSMKLWVGKYEVTNGEYRKLVPRHDSKGFKGHSLNGDRQPAVYVSWYKARDFCEAMTRRDRDELGGGVYRLPTDAEWSKAVGLGYESGSTPKDKDGKIRDMYPWGSQWPPPRGAGNYADQTARMAYINGVIVGYDDGYAVTAPVGTFNANVNGLYDIGGNVLEWVEDSYDGSVTKALRGASWFNFKPDNLLSSGRYGRRASYANDDVGFRCVFSRPGP
ncbi:MAG: hypothetical protein EOL87_17360 [Spartobacteria bacterium]|nr:hypothetical protein [Spartobacteria bacterium]